MEVVEEGRGCIAAEVVEEGRGCFGLRPLLFPVAGEDAEGSGRE